MNDRREHTVMQISFDMLVATLRGLDTTTWIPRENVVIGRHVLNPRYPLLQSGLVDVYQARVHPDKGVGRNRNFYKLALPYTKIKVRHLITDTFPETQFLRQIFYRLGDILLVQLDKTVISVDAKIVPRYSAEKLLGCLASLSTDRYIQAYPTLYRLTSVCRLIMRDMAKIGVVEIQPNGGRGRKGYKLVRPLEEVPIALLLPYLCSVSASRDYLNRLFFSVKDKPVSFLL